MKWTWNEMKMSWKWHEMNWNERMNERMNEWINEWMNESINQWSLPTSSSNNPPNVTVLFRCEIKLSLQSRAPFPGLIFQKRSKHDSFLRFFLCEIELWLQSCAHLASPSSKSAPTPVFYNFYVTPSSRYSLVCTICRPLLQIKAPNRGNRDPTSATTGAASESAFKVWWCGWHDGMMMWLPWRWECGPWQSSIIWKFSN